MLSLFRITPDTHRFPTRIIRGSPDPFVFDTLSRIRFFHHPCPFTEQFLEGLEKNFHKTKSSQFFHIETQRDRGGIGVHIHPGKWVVSVCVRTEDPVQPLLYLSISKPHQLSSTDPRVINS